MLSQFIDDIINNNFDNINQIQFKNDISQIIEKLSLFGSVLSLNNLLNLTIDTPDISINNRAILIDILDKLYDIDWIKEINEIIKSINKNMVLDIENEMLFNINIKNKYNLLYQSSNILLPLKNVEDKYLKIANKSWNDKYINFIKSDKSNKDFNWGDLSENPNITMDMVMSNLDKDW
jgi:hypothetical protein